MTNNLGIYITREEDKTNKRFSAMLHFAKKRTKIISSEYGLKIFLKNLIKSIIRWVNYKFTSLKNMCLDTKKEEEIISEGYYDIDKFGRLKKVKRPEDVKQETIGIRIELEEELK